MLVINILRSNLIKFLYMYTYDLHTETPDSRKQIRKNTNFEMKNSKPFLALFSSVCTNVNKMCID